MKFKICLIILLTIFIGIYLGLTTFNEYETKTVAYSDNNKIYFLQQGAYSSKESMNENTKIINNFIFFEEDSLYKVYVAMTTDKNIAQKTKNLFNERGIDIYIKEGYINNKNFIEQLKQYDILIKKTDDEEIIFNTILQILSEYKLVMENGK